jgi:CubicO group peptidase (beta-lactamase class C family)
MVVAVVTVAFGVRPIVAQSPTKEKEPAKIKANGKINDLLAPIRNKHDVPGMIGAFVKGEKVEAIGAVGVRKDGSKEPIEVTDVVHIGSCGKAMTATMIATLVEEKKLKWDSTILSVFPDLKDTINEDYAKVTLTDLLSHRAGLPRDARWDELGADKSPTEQRLAAIKAVLHDPPATKPGTEFEYSNVGYVIAARMAEEVTGSSWEDLMRKRLFKPLGMKSAGFGPLGTKGEVDQPWGHYVDKDGRRAAQTDDPAVAGPAGSNIHCSMSDWAKFAGLHIRGDEGKDGLFLRAETFKLLHTPPGGGKYAYGFRFDDSPGWRIFTHGGSNRAWQANITLYPSSDLAILVAVNQGGDDARKAAQEAFAALGRYYQTMGVPEPKD